MAYLFHVPPHPSDHIHFQLRSSEALSLVGDLPSNSTYHGKTTKKDKAYFGMFLQAEFCHTVILSVTANMPSSWLSLAHLGEFD